MKSLTGNFVLASPDLGDPNFFRTVVLMIQHSEEGAFGVVLNRPSDRTVKEIWEKLDEETPCENTQLVSLGGPVVGPLMAIHPFESLSDLEILDGVYFTTEKELLQELVTHTEEPYHLIIGYAGWAAGQLESELEVGSWITTPAKREFIFSQDEDLWVTVTKDITDDVLISALKLKNLPQDPSMN